MEKINMFFCNNMSEQVKLKPKLIYSTTQFCTFGYLRNCLFLTCSHLHTCFLKGNKLACNVLTLNVIKFTTLFYDVLNDTSYVYKLMMVL